MTRKVHNCSERENVGQRDGRHQAVATIKVPGPAVKLFRYTKGGVARGMATCLPTLPTYLPAYLRAYLYVHASETTETSAGNAQGLASMGALGGKTGCAFSWLQAVGLHGCSRCLCRSLSLSASVFAFTRLPWTRTTGGAKRTYRTRKKRRKVGSETLNHLASREFIESELHRAIRNCVRVCG